MAEHSSEMTVGLVIAYNLDLGDDTGIDEDHARTCLPNPILFVFT